MISSLSTAYADGERDSSLKNQPVEQSAFSLKTNLLYDAALSPSIEVEYKFASHWSVNAEYSIAWWSSKPDHKYYQLMQISPEVRFWFNPDRKCRGHYFGAFVGAGLYDLENSADGYQGEFAMAGLSYGYMFPIGKALSLEAGLGFGWLATEYDEYAPYQGHSAQAAKARSSSSSPMWKAITLVKLCKCLSGLKMS